MPFSKIKLSIAKILEKEKYVGRVSTVKTGQFDELKIELRYTEKVPAIRHIKRISKPGQRIYVSSKELPRVLNGYGLAVISTSKGIMTNREATAQNMGGEFVCEIW